ncbi:MAG: prolipoprotein diacylglyceryl transferase [Bacteroidaceae bacterium]|nr:prolipoprotein diacylglyceryl transferase [Bacteroidaceae bacterium]
MGLPLFIDWQPSVEAFSIGPVTVRWYALCWVLAILSGFLFVRWMYRQEQIDPAPDKRGKLQPTGKFDPLLFYCFFGIIIGARLGHCLFYEPDYYLTSTQGWIEMLLPIKYDTFPSEWHYTGYAGLASHGGTIGLFLAIVLYLRRTKLPTMQVLDIFGVTAAMPAAFIRLGNLMNSEIIGSQTDVPWAFLFHTQEAMVGDQLVPRHPSQLYEALAYIVIFLIAYLIYKKWRRAGSGFYFGFCLASIFTFRFFIEFLKEVQGGVDDGTLPLDMGQMLSIPFVLIGIFFMVRAKRKQLQ